jgi:hypothetical protein
MTSALEQEATAIFAAQLAAFLDEAVAKLDALGAGPQDPPLGAEKPAKKPRKKVGVIASREELLAGLHPR